MSQISGLYDLQTVTEEKINFLTHGFGALLSLFALGTLVTAGAAKGIGAAIVCSIYGLSLVQLFGISTFYHACSSVALKNKARVWDHCAIFVLIAGSYTPFMALSLNDWKGFAILLLIWSLAVFGVWYKCRSKNPFGAASVALYLLMGWLVLLVWQPLTLSLSAAGLAWLVAGGVVYSLGVPFYVWTSLRYSHGIWHLFVLAGAACHFVSVRYFVL